MVGIFKRLFRVAEAKTHAAIDNMEDPIKMTEQGIRDLKKDLELDNLIVWETLDHDQVQDIVNGIVF